MKTFPQISKLSRRRTLAAAWAGLFVCGLVLTGCVVESVYPFYTAKDIAFDPALVGTWVDANTTNDVNEFWQFQRAGDSGYTFTLASGNETNTYDATLFRLDRHAWLDLCPTNRFANQLPLHYLFKVELASPSLKFQVLDYKWLTELLEKNPQALRHILVPRKPGNTNNLELALTASTSDLQIFILKYANDTNAFTSLDELKRWQ